MTTDKLLLLARAYCAGENIGLRGLSKRVGTDKLFNRLAEGKGCTPAVAARAERWLVTNWPAVPWPEGVDRPEIAVTEEAAAMPLIYEEDDTQRAEREAAEEADRLFQARLRIVEAQRREEQERARLTEADRVREAMRVLETASPAVVFDEKCRKAVEGCDLRSQRPSPPSLGGLTPGQMELLARQQMSAEMAAANDRTARERWVASQQEVIKSLQAGQSPDNARAIAAAFRAQKGG